MIFRLGGKSRVMKTKKWFVFPKSQYFNSLTRGLDKFDSLYPILWECNFTCLRNQTQKKMGAENQNVCPIEKKLETLLYFFIT